MIKAFTTEDGVTHIVPKNASMVMDGNAHTIAPPRSSVTPHDDFKNWPEFQRELAHLINKHSLERLEQELIRFGYARDCILGNN